MNYQTILNQNLKTESDYTYKTVKRKKQAYCGTCNKQINPGEYAIVYYYIVSVIEQFNFDKKEYLHEIRSVGMTCLLENCKNDYLKKINNYNTEKFKTIKTK